MYLNNHLSKEQFWGIKNHILPLTVHLFQGVLEAELTEVKERERSLQKELEVLQVASRGQERDLLTLNSVLQSNKDVINVRQTHALVQQTHMMIYMSYSEGHSLPFLVLAFASGTG